MLAALRSASVSHRQPALRGGRRGAAPRHPRQIALVRSAEPTQDVGSGGRKSGGESVVDDFNVVVYNDTTDDTSKALTPFRTNKAMLELMSPMLRKAISDASQGGKKCDTIVVSGSVEAWRFILDYPLMRTKALKEAVSENDERTLPLVGDVLDTALNHFMDPVVEEMMEVFTFWKWQTLRLESTKLDRPDSVLWWIGLAEEHLRLDLAAPAIQALVNWRSDSYHDASFFLVHWRELIDIGRSRHKGSPLWSLVERLVASKP